MLVCPLQPKEPLSVTLYRRLLCILPLARRFPIFVFCFPFLVGFGGFFRIDEIKNIALMSLYFVIISQFTCLSAKTIGINPASRKIAGDLLDIHAV